MYTDSMTILTVRNDKCRQFARGRRSLVSGVTTKVDLLANVGWSE